MRWVINSTNRGRVLQPHEAALELYGLKEVVGKEDNPEIIRMFNDLGYDGEKLKDETAWCAAFVNWILMKQGYLYTGKLTARSFLDLPGEVEKPELGDIAIFWREDPSSWKGHVAFYITERSGWIYVLGGNQGNEVSIKAYAKKRLLGYRRPQKVAI